LSSPQPDQPLILYVSTSHTIVSGALVQEKETMKNVKKVSHQVLIYFVSEALAGPKKYYSEIKKICYTVVISVKKLHHYFKAHEVSVLTNQPLNDIFGNKDSSGRIGKWAMELSEHVIDFEKRSIIKSQILANFIEDWTEATSYTEDSVLESSWQVYYDRAYGSTGAGATIILISPSGLKLRYATRLQFTKETDKCTNNIVEYEAVLLGFRML
jgi:hypothetical protein